MLLKYVIDPTAIQVYFLFYSCGIARYTNWMDVLEFYVTAALASIDGGTFLYGRLSPSQILFCHHYGRSYGSYSLFISSSKKSGGSSHIYVIIFRANFHGFHLTAWHMKSMKLVILSHCTEIGKFTFWLITRLVMVRFWFWSQILIPESNSKID